MPAKYRCLQYAEQEVCDKSATYAIGHNPLSYGLPFWQQVGTCHVLSSKYTARVLLNHMSANFRDTSADAEMMIFVIGGLLDTLSTLLQWVSWVLCLSFFVNLDNVSWLRALRRFATRLFLGEQRNPEDVDEPQDSSKTSRDTKPDMLRIARANTA